MLPFDVGKRVFHDIYGEGEIVAIDSYKDKLGDVYVTGRYGVEFDDHRLTAKPAFFYTNELELI